MGIGNRQCDLKDNPTKNIQAAPPLHTPSHLQASTFRVQQDTQVLKKLLDKLTICTHSGIVNAGKHMASFSALKTTSKKWKDAAQKTGTDCFAYARAFVVLIAARIGRSGCSVLENHAVSIDGKIYHGIPDFDMVRFPITEMSHVLFKGFVSKVVGKIIKGLSVIQRGVASMRCIDCCVDRGEERLIYDIVNHPGSMAAHCWVS